MFKVTSKIRMAALSAALATSVAHVAPVAVLGTASTLTITGEANAFDFNKARRNIQRDLGKARKNISRDVKKATRSLNKNGVGGKVAVGIGVGLLTGIATDSAAAGIITGVAVAAAPEVFKRDLFDSYGGQMEWSGSVTSKKKRIVVAPGREVSSEARQRVSEEVKADVMEIQTALKELGLYSLRIDGDFGPGSRAGVKEFQRMLGNPETGVLTAEERHRLFIRASDNGYVRQASLGLPEGVTEDSLAPVNVVPSSQNVIPEYRLAKSQLDALTGDYLKSGALSAITAVSLNGDGSVVFEVMAADGVSKQTVEGAITGVYAEPHSLAPEWARVYYRGAEGAEAIILNTRDDFASADEASQWIADVNSRVGLIAKLTGVEQAAEPETVIADAEKPDATISADEDGVIRVGQGSTDDPLEPIEEVAGIEPETEAPIEVVAQAPGSEAQPSVQVASVDAQQDLQATCRESIYVSMSFPEGHDPVSHYNITPPPGTIMMDNGDGTAYFAGSCVQGEYAFSYVHIDQGQTQDDWKHTERAGQFMLASNAEQCAIDLNTPDGAAQVQCF